VPLTAPPQRILIVDDNVDASETLAILLRLAGHDVRTVHDGAAALGVADEFKPEVALLDIGLPGKNGYQLAHALRERPDGAAMLLLAVTGYGGDDDRRRSREAGFDHHFTKPLDPDALNNFLVERLPGNSADRPQATPEHV
jgi:DNA-binding response OmpR family regulator